MSNSVCCMRYHAPNRPIDTAGQTPSFAVSCDGMTGGSNGGVPVQYSYSIPAGTGYAANGDLLSVNDSVMGSWTYTYDGVNRLSTAQASSGSYLGVNIAGAALGWQYDAFGNRLWQSSSSAVLPSGSVQYAAGNNQATGSGLAAAPSVSTVNFTNDGAGNLQFDGNNQYTYDAEGRLASVNGSVQYLYDAEGRRVAKLDAYGNVTNQYLLGLGGEQVSEVDGSGNWLHSNAYAAGKLLATYDANGLHFHFTDWLGSRRVQGSGTGLLEDTCQSLPFGDGLQCSSGDVTEHHFTGKERDAESGLDFFGARYYGSAMGRWLSPDWASKPEAVPYSKLDNPQTLNLYGYMRDNPLGGFDTDGHDAVILNDSRAAYGAGHNASVVGNDKDGWTYYSKNGGLGTSGNTRTEFKTFKDFQKSKDSERYDQAARMKTTPKQDAKMKEAGDSNYNKPFNETEKKGADGTNKVENCADLTATVLSAGGIAIDKPKFDLPVVNPLPVGPPVVDIKTNMTYPNAQYNDVVKNNQTTPVPAHTNQ